MKKRKKEGKHEHKAAALFVVGVLIICSIALLKDPRVIGYATKEQSIEALNKHSYSAVYETWTLMFKTEGSGDLEIDEVSDAFYSLGMPEIRCGNDIVNYEQKNGKFIVKDYECNQVGSLTMEVRMEGIQTIKLLFGNREYASNTAIRKEKI